MSLRFLLCVVLVLTLVPLSAQAQEEEEPLKVGVLVFASGSVDASSRRAVAAAFTKRFTLAEGFRLYASRRVVQAMRTKGIALAQLIRGEDYVNAARKVGLDQLVVVYLHGERSTSFDFSYTLDLWYADAENGDLIKNEKLTCDHCTKHTLAENAPRYAASFYKGPYRFYFDTKPSGAVITENGIELGSTPFRTPVPSGEHKFVISKPGYVDLEIEFGIYDRPLFVGDPPRNDS